MGSCLTSSPHVPDAAWPAWVTCTMTWVARARPGWDTAGKLEQAGHGRCCGLQVPDCLGSCGGGRGWPSALLPCWPPAPPLGTFCAKLGASSHQPPGGRAAGPLGKGEGIGPWIPHSLGKRPVSRCWACWVSEGGTAVLLSGSGFALSLGLCSAQAPPRTEVKPHQGSALAPRTAASAPRTAPGLTGWGLLICGPRGRPEHNVVNCTPERDL